MSPDQQKEILQSLESTGVWVAPSLRSTADPNEIAQQIKGAQHPVKVLVIERPPVERGRPLTTAQTAQKMDSWLQLEKQKGIVIVVTQQPRNVAAYGGFFLRGNREEVQKIVQGAAKTFNTQGYAAGIGQIVREFDAAEAGSSRTGSMALLVIIGVPVGGVWFLVRRGKKKREEETVALRNETRELSAQLAPDYEKLASDYEFAIVAEQDPTRKRELQEANNRAGTAFSAAMKQLNNAEEYNALAGARNGLMQAREQMQRARNILDGKPEDEGLYQAPPPQFGSQRVAGAFDNGGFGQGNVFDNDEIPPLGQNYPGARPGYALDFFTSQPVPVDQLVPVDIDVNGQRKRVWATRESAQRVFSGQPAVATVNYQGQQVPWYGAPNSYNPWNDFGSTMLQMMAMNMMMNAMFSSHYGGVHHHYHDSGGWDSGGGSGWNNDWNSNDSQSGGLNNDYSDAGSASLDAPFAGGWSDGGASDAGSASLDMFGSSDFGGGWGGDSS
jgi:hypothetical protein